MRKEFEMNDDQLQKILDACKPVPYLVFGGKPPISPQENANNAWLTLGQQMGFQHESVEPVSGKGSKFFTAEQRS